MLFAALAVQVLAVVTAIMLARRNREHVRGAVALAVLATASLLHTAVLAMLPPSPSGPLQGWVRLLVDVERAINLVQYIIIPWLAVTLAVSPERRRFATLLVVAAWLLESIVLAALYPSPLVRGAGLQRIYLATDLICMFAAIVAIVAWARRNITAKRSPNSVQMLSIALVVMDLAVLLAPVSPWRGYVFGSNYSGVQFFITLCFTVISIVQVILWRFSDG